MSDETINFYDIVRSGFYKSVRGAPGCLPGDTECVWFSVMQTHDEARVGAKGRTYLRQGASLEWVEVPESYHTAKNRDSDIKRWNEMETDKGYSLIHQQGRCRTSKI